MGKQLLPLLVSLVAGRIPVPARQRRVHLGEVTDRIDHRDDGSGHFHTFVRVIGTRSLQGMRGIMDGEDGIANRGRPVERHPRNAGARLPNHDVVMVRVSLDHDADRHDPVGTAIEQGLRGERQLESTGYPEHGHCTCVQGPQGPLGTIEKPVGDGLIPRGHGDPDVKARRIGSTFNYPGHAPSPMSIW